MFANSRVRKIKPEMLRRWIKSHDPVKGTFKRRCCTVEEAFEEDVLSELLVADWQQERDGTQ